MQPNLSNVFFTSEGMIINSMLNTPRRCTGYDQTAFGPNGMAKELWKARIIMVGYELKKKQRRRPKLKTLCFYQLSTLDLERLRQLSV